MFLFIWWFLCMANKWINYDQIKNHTYFSLVTEETSCSKRYDFNISLLNHLGSFGGVTFCNWAYCWFKLLYVSIILSSWVVPTMMQERKCLVNSWSEGNWTSRYASLHASNHGVDCGISNLRPSEMLAPKLLLLEFNTLFSCQEYSCSHE